MSRTHLGLLMSLPGLFSWISASMGCLLYVAVTEHLRGAHCLWRVSVPTPGSPTTCAHPAQQGPTQRRSRRSTADENYTYFILTQDLNWNLSNTMEVSQNILRSYHFPSPQTAFMHCDCSLSFLGSVFLNV